MVVVMRHADQRHSLGKAELPGEDLRRAGHLVEPAAVKTGGFRAAQQLQALRRFLQHRTGNRAGQIRVIPTGQPGVDISDIAPHAAQRRHHRIDRSLRIFRRVLVAGKALLLVVDDQARSIGLASLRPARRPNCACREAQGPRDKPSRRDRASRGHARSARWQSRSRAGESQRAPSVRVASHRAARNPASPSLGCRGPIRLFGVKPCALKVTVAVLHQS